MWLLEAFSLHTGCILFLLDDADRSSQGTNDDLFTNEQTGTCLVPRRELEGSSGGSPGCSDAPSPAPREGRPRPRAWSCRSPLDVAPEEATATVCINYTSLLLLPWIPQASFRCEALQGQELIPSWTWTPGPPQDGPLPLCPNPCVPRAEVRPGPAAHGVECLPRNRGDRGRGGRLSSLPTHIPEFSSLCTNPTNPVPLAGGFCP